MNKLKLGKMKSKELAEWFNISYNSYTHNIDGYLEKLKDYADFEKVYGGVIIQTIYIEEYNKHMNTEAVKIYMRYLNESNDNLMSLAGMTRKCQKDGYYSNLKDRQIQRTLQKAGIYLFGKTNPHGQKIFSGEVGNKQYCWAVKVDDYNNYRFLTEQEQEVFDQLKRNYNNSPEGKKANDSEKSLTAALTKNEISNDEYAERMTMLYENNYKSRVIDVMMEKYGIIIVHATYHEVLMSLQEQLNKGYISEQYCTDGFVIECQKMEGIYDGE